MWNGSVTAVLDDVEYWYGTGTNSLVEYDYVKDIDCAYLYLGSK